jgi:hypothetical protein
MGGRIDVEADHILELLREPRIARQLEHADAMGRQLLGLKGGTASAGLSRTWMQ